MNRIAKRWSTLLVRTICCVSVGGMLSACSTVRTTFDHNSEGWHSTADGIDAIDCAEGRLDPCLRISDQADSQFNRLAAPAAFTGDLRKFNRGILAYDYLVKQTFGPHPFPQNGEIRIHSVVGGQPEMARIDVMPATPPLHSWLNYSARLNGPEWGYEDAAWEQLLANVTAIEIGIELDDGYDVVRVDNPTLSNNPLVICYLHRLQGNHVGHEEWWVKFINLGRSRDVVFRKVPR